MNAFELCNAFVASMDKTPGAKPLRTVVDENGDFTIEEEGADDSVEGCSDDRFGRRARSMHPADCVSSPVSNPRLNDSVCCG
jgi:hypothetical protein